MDADSQPPRRDHQRTHTMRDYIVTCGKLLDERGKLNRPAFFGSNR